MFVFSAYSIIHYTLSIAFCMYHMHSSVCLQWEEMYQVGLCLVIVDHFLTLTFVLLLYHMIIQLRCAHSEKKYGSPSYCDHCNMKCAFPKPEDIKQKVL